MASECLWDSPPTELELTGRDVHIWCGLLDKPERRIRQLAKVLSDDERERADCFHFEKNRRRYIVSHGQLRMILGRYLGREPGQLQFRQSQRGKPLLVQAQGEDELCFNMSHSHELALYAVSCGRNLGIDIEYIRPITNAEQIVERYFSKQEKAAFQALPQSQKLQAFFRYWTRKEAFLKATGEGLYQSLDAFTVSLAGQERPDLVHFKDSTQGTSRWLIHPMTPASGYVAALSTEEGSGNIEYWHLVD